jgi:hypothetical protein
MIKWWTLRRIIIISLTYGACIELAAQAKVYVGGNFLLRKQALEVDDPGGYLLADLFVRRLRYDLSVEYSVNNRLSLTTGLQRIFFVRDVNFAPGSPGAAILTRTNPRTGFQIPLGARYHLIRQTSPGRWRAGAQGGVNFAFVEQGDGSLAAAKAAGINTDIFQEILSRHFVAIDLGAFVKYRLSPRTNLVYSFSYVHSLADVISIQHVSYDVLYGGVTRRYTAQTRADGSASVHGFGLQFALGREKDATPINGRKASHRIVIEGLPRVVLPRPGDAGRVHVGSNFLIRGQLIDTEDPGGYLLHAPMATHPTVDIHFEARINDRISITSGLQRIFFIRGVNNPVGLAGTTVHFGRSAPFLGVQVPLGVRYNLFSKFLPSRWRVGVQGGVNYAMTEEGSARSSTSAQIGNHRFTAQSNYRMVNTRFVALDAGIFAKLRISKGTNLVYSYSYVHSLANQANVTDISYEVTSGGVTRHYTARSQSNGSASVHGLGLQFALVR